MKMRRLIPLLTLGAMAAMVFASPALAAPGDLDTSFGEDGQVHAPVGGWATDLVLQPDGKILAVGSSKNGTNYDFAVTRHNPDGSPDASFHSDGKLTTDFGASDGASAVALQPDDKIVVVGYSGGRFAVARYNANGSPDTSFDTDGRVTTDFVDGEARDVAVQPDGKIVVAGIEAPNSNDNFVVVRYNADGSLDTSFDGDGKIKTDFSQDPVNWAGQDTAWALALQPDGKILVGGNTWLPGWPTHGTNDFALVRYNEDGSLDGGDGDSTPGDSFDGDGKVTTDLFGGSSEQALGLALGPDGKIVLAGNSFPAEGDTSDFDNADFALARYNPDGSLDESFDSDGKLRTDFSSASEASDEEVWDVAIQPDGKVVAAGGAGFRSRVPYATARYNPDGSLDATFGTGGKGDLSVSGSRPALALQPDGKLVLAGNSSGFHLVRYYGGDDSTAPGVVTDLMAATQAADVTLSWTNPTDPDFEATRILRSTIGYANGANQITGQTRVYEGPATSYTDAGLAQGTRYYYTAFARDNDGNWAVAAENNVLIEDFTPPQTNVLSGPSGQTNNDKPTFTFGASDNVSPGADLLYAYKVVAGGVAPEDVTWSDYSASTSATLGDASGLEQGPYTFFVKAKDQKGNEDESPASRSFTVDTTAPAAPMITNPLNNSYDRDGIIAFSGAAEAGTSLQVFEGASPRGTPVSVTASGAWSKTLSGVVDGPHTYTVKATDRAGNTSAASASTTVRVDRNSPSGTLTINSGASSTGSRTVALALRATDPAPASGVSLMRFRNENTNTWSPWQAYTTSKAWTLSSGAGTKAVYVQYQDRAGNVSTPARDTITYAP